MRKARILFIIGAAVLLLTAAMHLIAVLGPPQPSNDDEAAMFRLMTTVRLELPGSQPTMMDLFQGFNASFSVFLGFAGTISVVVIRVGGENLRLLRAATILNVLTTAIMIVVSLIYFFILPTVCLSAAFVPFAGSLLMQFNARTP